LIDKYSLAANPTHRAYGITFRSKWLDANSITVVVMHMHPINIHIKANNHSGCKSGVKHTCGLLYRVIHDHMRPRRVSPKIEHKYLISKAVNYHIYISRVV
jgi:hypothetical protein